MHFKPMICLYLAVTAICLSPNHSAFADTAITGTIPIAIVDQQPITVDEFRQRYEGIIWPGRHIESQQAQQKAEVLLSMVAERLLAKYGLQYGFADDPSVKMVLTSLEQALVRDRLYLTEVKEKVKVTDQDIADAYTLYAAPRVVRLFRVATMAEAAALSLDLQNGGDIDSLAREMGNDPNLTRQIMFTWGESPAHVDSIIFNLKINQTGPYFEWNGLYYFAKIKNIMTPSAFDDQDFANQHGKLKRLLQERKEAKRLLEFVPTIMRGQKAVIRREALQMLSRQVQAIIEAQRDSIPNLQEPFAFTFRDLDSLETRLQASLKQTAVFFDQSKWTIAELLTKLEIHGLVVVPAREIAPQLAQIIQDHLDSHWLTLEGYQRGLDRHPDVRRDLEVWRQAYLSKLAKAYLESLQSTDELPLLIKVREILLPTEAKAQEIWRLLERGDDFAKLARVHSIRPGFAERAGVWDYFNPQSEHPEIGALADTLKPGQRFGPVALPEGYAIYELLDKKLAPRLAVAAFKATDSGNAGSVLVDQELARLAKAYGVSINFTLLKDVPVTSINMFTVRYLGFGGTIPAIPPLERMYKWHDLMDQQAP